MTGVRSGTVERVELHSIGDRVEIAPGVMMPRLGLGTSHVRGGDVAVEILAGLSLGFRLIDTAAAYGNEAEIGDVLRRAPVPREELFITTKVWNRDQGYESTLRAFDESRRRLGLEYVDLYLIHWPEPTRTRDTWRALEELKARGDVRAIGVSNFTQPDFELLFEWAEVTPAVDQIEFHPYLQRPDLVTYCRERRITVEAWSPLMRGRGTDLPLLAEIGRRHGKTAPQVTLRWILQKGIVTIPKSVHPERLREDADIFDFELSGEEMGAIDALNRGRHGT